MGQLFALSFDAQASPAISFTNTTECESTPLFGWGFAWYPGNENASMVVKDATSPFNNSLTKVMQDWKHFRSANFICHLRGAAKRISQIGTQPFARTYAGRDFILVHDGDLNMKKVREYINGEKIFFEPIGKTDSELVFCYILSQLHKNNARTFKEFGYKKLTDLLRTFASFGTANFILADNYDMILFHGPHHSHGLYWTRLKPPHTSTTLMTDNLCLDISDPLDLNRTMIIAATSPLSADGWQALQTDQLIVIRRAELKWDSLQEIEILKEDKKEQNTTPSISQPLIITNPPASCVLEIMHETIYHYQQPVEHSSHTLRLQPVHDTLQEVIKFECAITPANIKNGEKIYFEDVFGNQTFFLTVDQPYTEMRILSQSIVKIHLPPPIDFTTEIRRASIPLVWMPWQRQMMMSYLLPPELPESQLRELSEYAMGFVERNDYDLFETLNDINHTLYQDITYAPGSTTLKSTPFEVFIKRQGVCQDFANLFICLARLLNIPARYRVGYIDARTNYSNNSQADASHAWVELFLPYVGWRGFDPTNGCLASLDHVRVACGRNYRDATPTSGTIYKGGGQEDLSVKVSVKQI
jgi:transglutaminase-like putative cysteine protease/predicted glutamine amidotransferase